MADPRRPLWIRGRTARACRRGAVAPTSRSSAVRSLGFKADPWGRPCPPSTLRSSRRWRPRSRGGGPGPRSSSATRASTAPCSGAARLCCGRSTTRDRRRADHVTARRDRRGAQLGLPLHLGSRSARLPAAAEATRASSTLRQRLGAADHATGERFFPSTSCLSSPVTATATGAHRQRRVGPDPARRLRRALDAAWRIFELGIEIDAELGAFLANVADRAVLRWQDIDEGIWEVRGGAVPLPLLEAHELGSTSTTRAGAPARRSHPRGDPHRRLERRGRRVHPGVRAATSSTRRC